MTRLRALAWCVAALLVATPAAAQDVTLRGTLTGADHQTYREVPFRVPAGVSRITVEFAYTGREQRATIDLGLRDPVRFRGWSGGNKSRFTLSEADATPSYLAGPLPAGEWKLVLGVPNLRKDGRADYTARIWFGPDEAPALNPAPGWYRGDLHLHTGHSDGSCPGQGGKPAPCPVHKTVEAAAARGLDFIAVTDHNTTSHASALRELQPHYDRLLLIPGREVTTFQGHANVFGPTGFIDFQLGSRRAPALATILAQVAKAGGVISINHPAAPSGEACMGCGWTAKGVDYARIQAVEAINGAILAQAGGSDRLLSGVPFWEARLNEGRRMTAIGGSDNHNATLDPTRPSAVGMPTTVVRADRLSQAGVLDAIRAGRVFVDLTGSRDKLLEVTLAMGDDLIEMGGAVEAPAGVSLLLSARVVGAAGGVATVAWDGPALGPLGERRISGGDETPAFNLVSDGRPHWIRVDVRGPDGRLWLLGNPIYLNPGARPAR